MSQLYYIDLMVIGHKNKSECLKETDMQHLWVLLNYKFWILLVQLYHLEKIIKCLTTNIENRKKSELNNLITFKSL